MAERIGKDAKAKRVVVATHGHCFDGLCSAVMFTRLLRHVHGTGDLSFVYKAFGYGPGQNGVAPSALDGDINAILDFRFSVAPSLTWYFDHHVSAFPTPAEREAFEAHTSGYARVPSSEWRWFHDGTYSSCTKLIADVGAKYFDLDPAPMENLVKWADLIDSASFPNPHMPVARSEPELQLMTVVEHMGDDAFLEKAVPRLLNEPVAEVARSPEVSQAFNPLRESHEAFVALVKKAAVCMQSVVLVDLSDQVVEVASKFVTYALYPTSVYSVILSRSKSKCKISVGFNPWCGGQRRHNIAALCERYGGGGHPVVGAVSVAADRVDDAQRIAREIVAELMT